MGWHEILTILLSVVTGLIGLVLALVGFIAKRALDQVENQRNEIQGLQVRLGVLEGAKVGDKVDGHEVRIRGLENELTEIRSDLKAIREMLERALSRDHDDRGTRGGKS